ncbi:MAG: RagB/SusD family nutrient uptake outer membrane protein [Candidatus Azobacteroides sp.]|nr:RagB/SusD family nutrient uptake outer membrane protein [Candidatus Azobacteroides sp.]
MKKIIYILLITGIGVFSSCDDELDPETGLPGAQPEDEVIYNYNNTQQILNGLYTYLPNGLFYIGGEAMLAGASDEAEFTIETNDIQKFNTGAWNAINNPDPAWKNNFAGIYAVNLFLQKADSVDLDYLKDDPSSSSQEAYEQYMENINRWKYEARGLRAFFYSELVKRYGGVPIITEPLGLTSDFAEIKRNTLAECVQFIADECDSVANVLPVKYGEDGDLGRITKGTALAIKSRILLYAASDLFNDPTWSQGYAYPEYISMTDNKSRQERWVEAAEAADAVLGLGVYNFNPDSLGGLGGLFRTYLSPEIILARRGGVSNDFERINYPIGYDGGRSGLTPLGNLVDAFERLQGTNAVPFDWNNPEHAADPYASRDPRLAAYVLTNNVLFNGGRSETEEGPRPVEIWEGGLDGKGVPRATRTGYYLHKYIDPNLDLLKNQSSVHTWIIIRYSEIMLNYAEAVNEAYGANGKLPGADMTPRQILVEIRTRVPMPTARSTSQDELREMIRHERQVELAFEDHRLWDVRRWMIAPETLGVPARGVEIKKLGEDEFAYHPVEVESRVWHDKMYFYPIPQKEIQITQWPQNPLW